MFVAEVRQLLERVRSLLTTCDPATVTGPVAVELVRLFVDLERAGAAGKALFARRVEESGTYAGTGHRDAGDWLSDVAGEPRGHARAVLHTARHLEDLPEVREAFIEGTLSGSQVAEIADAGAVAPSAIPALLETARSGSFASLRREAERARWTTLGQDDAASRDVTGPRLMVHALCEL
ncbi:MAG TPA: DUF222 domain-containing protein [Acidimicrobiales bacterium]|nr:DUF222 domain-containing protein [Acidimicrobiales bacterium]